MLMQEAFLSSTSSTAVLQCLFQDPIPKSRPLAAAWMDLEMVILSEAIQKEKDKYHMTSLMCGIFKKWYK